MTTWLRGPLSSPDCANCPFARNGKPSSPVAGEGPDNAAWIVVGEGPGQQEVRQGRPLVGPTGQLLNRAIKMAGGTREHGFLANATLCKPTPGSSEAMRHQAAVACRPRLNEELAQFPGKPILSLGGVASQGFLGQKFSITQLAGSAHTVDVDTTGARVVIPTIHPAAILRGGAGDSGSGAHAVDMLFLNLVYDFAKVMRLGSGAQNVIFTPDIETEWEDPLRAERLIEGITRDARRVRVIGCDTETYTDVDADGNQHSALETQHAKLSAVAFATPERAVSVTWNVVTKRALNFMRALMGDSTIEKVFHNCLLGDSRVWLADGRRIRIAQLVREKYRGKVLTVNERTGLIEPKKVIGWIKGGVRPYADWRRINVRGKGCLRLTCDHEVITTRGRVRADAVVVGDQILTDRVDLTPRQRELIFGSLLGDASISLSGLYRSPKITFAHELTAQGDFTRFKAQVLGDLITKVQVRDNQRGFSAGKKDAKLLVATTHADARLHEAYDTCIINGARHFTDTWSNKLSDAALAIWFCDDGHRQASNASICVEAFKDKGVMRLVKFLKKRGWPVKLRPRKGDNALYLYISGPMGRGMSKSMTDFWTTMAKYMPLCMKWKIPERFQHLVDGKYWTARETETPCAWADTVIESGPLMRQAKDRRRYGGYTVREGKNGFPQFCLEIEGNRNFIAEGLAVSNCLYDIPVLRRHTVLTRGKITDTMLLHHNAFPGLAHGLQRVVTQFLIAHPWKAEYREGDETPEEHTRYNALDILGTVRVKPQLEICVKKSRAEKTYEIDMKMAKAAMQMSWVGMHVSREINADLRKYFTEEAIIARDVVHARVSEPGIWEEFQQNLSFEQAKKRRKKDSDDFEARQQKRLLELEKVFKKKLKQKGFELDIDSAQHVAAYLRACGVPLTLETEKGAISTKRDILEGLAHHETVRKLLDYREVTKMNSTFVRPLPFYMDRDDRVHPTWSVHKITGRWASAMPVVSNLPKDDKKKNRPNLRKQYTAPKGRILVGADFKQLEGRIIALLSNDPFLCRVFNENRDLHSEMARTVWPKFDSLPPDERKKLRDMVKRPEYCLVPGTKILRRDLSWANIEDLRTGDELVGFTASQPNERWTENYFKPAVVKRRKLLRQQCYRIVTDRGEVTASAQHMWVARQPYAAPKYKAVGTKGWFRTDSLCVGDEMIFTSEPWQFAESREAGYLAGIYDGEGWIAKKGVGFAQNPGVALDNVEAIQQRLGIEAHTANKATRKEKIVRSEIAGGIWGSLRFLGMIRPDRLLLKSDKVWDGRRLRCKGEGAKILSIEPVGLRDVVAVMTTTETFIAEGFLSHNCALYGGAPETSWQAVVRDYPTVQLADIVRMVALMKKNMPRIDQWHDELVANVMQTLEIRSFLYGRRRMFPMGNASPSEIYNFPVQAAGADIMDTGMANLMDKLPDTADIISQVHDFVGVECYEDDAEKIRDIVVECCTQQHTVNGVTVDFPVDAHIGHSLADV